jgi:uncharacterized protein YkwD
MSRFMSLALLVAVALVLVVPAGASASSPALVMLKRVNHVRAKHGLRKLHFSSSLQHSARRYSRHQMHSGYFGHSSRIHASGRYHTLGEILEMHSSYNPAVGFTLRDWMHSPPHRSIILSSAFRFAGAGAATGRFHGRRMTIWTMHFGRR